RHDAVRTGCEPALIADRDERVRQVLRRADAAGCTVEDDADGVGRHGSGRARRQRARGDCGPSLCYAGANKVHAPETTGPRHSVCLTFDFDTQSGFIARGMTTPTPLSRGEFGLTGARRILALLKATGIKATFFTPGFTIESHPRACEAVVADGHEIGHH